MHEWYYGINESFRRVITITFFIIVFVLLAGCRKAEIPDNYLGKSIISGETETDRFGSMRIIGEGQEVYIYRDKTFIMAAYADGSVKDISKRTRLKEWDELLGILNFNVNMKEGDVAVLSKEQFVQYVKSLYP